MHKSEAITVPKSNATATKDPVPVLVQDPRSPSSWDLAVLHEWRWINQVAGIWEGRVTIGTGGTSLKQWVPGTRLRRVHADWCGEPMPLPTGEDENMGTEAASLSRDARRRVTDRA